MQITVVLLILRWSLSSVAEERLHDHSNSYRREHLIGGYLQFQRCSTLSSGWSTVMVLEKYLSALPLDPQATGSGRVGRGKKGESLQD